MREKSLGNAVKERLESTKNKKIERIGRERSFKRKSWDKGRAQMANGRTVKSWTLDPRIVQRRQGEAED